MALIVVGLSHVGAPLAVRERLAYGSAEAPEAVLSALTAADAREGVLLSTCNRTELYLVEGEAEAASAVWDQFSARLGEAAAPYGYVHRDREAVGHLFRVASGLDSMILGEAQIHGQVRDAWEHCRSRSGAVLNRLFQTALQVAGRVRSETQLGRGAASVSSAAVQLSKQIFGSLSGRRAMILGAGEMAELALECLRAEGVRAAIVANRTYDRAVELARRYDATAMHYDECWASLADVDVILCSTAAPRPIVMTSHIEPAIRARGDRPLCILDIAVPRDVDAAVGKLDNVFLYDLDDLQSVIAANIERRRADVPTAEELIATEVERYWDWVAGLAAVPVLTSIREQVDRIRQRELEDALRRLKDLTPEQREAVEALSKSLANKFLHEPTVRLRAAAANGRGLGVVDAARYLFGLESRSQEPSETKDPEPTT